MNKNLREFISQGIQELLHHLDLSSPVSWEAYPPISHEILYLIKIEDIPQPPLLRTETPFIDIRSPKFSILEILITAT